ncbi:MAG TPA: MFS transporter [Candidatus Saccharimonadia bacterium]
MATDSIAAEMPDAEMPRSAQHHASQFSARRRMLALAIVALAFVMDLLDSTIVNIAIPSIQTNLHASYAAIQWLIAGYLLSFATLLITGGRMGDVYGYRRLFLIGVSGFTLASLISGLAWSPESLIAARLVQGAMAAFMVPQVMSLMQVMFNPQERAGVMGLFGALGGLAATLGPIIGGLLIQWNIAGLDWRPIFLINIPVGLFALVAGWKVLPPGKSEHPLHLDWMGTLVVVSGLLLLIFPLIQGRELDWPQWIFVMLAASLPTFALFAWYERKKDKADGSALIVPSLFKTRTFVTGLGTNVFFEMLFIGFFLINTLMLQAGLGYSVIKAALTGIGFAVGIGLSIGVLGQKLLPKFGRNVIFMGIGLMALGYSGLAWLVSQYGFDVQPLALTFSLLLAGLGAGLVMTPIFSVVLMDVDVKHAGSASGVMNALQQVGGAVGIALIGVLFFGLISNHASTSAQDEVPSIRTQLTAAGIPAVAQDPITDQFVQCFTDRSKQKDPSETPASCEVKPAAPAAPPLPANLPPAQRAAAEQQIQAARAAAIAKVGPILQGAGKTANMHNFSYAFSWSVAYEVLLLAILAGLSFLLPRHIKTDGGMGH